MDDTFGRVLFVGIVVLFIGLGEALRKAKGEGARRIKTVLLTCVCAAAGSVVFILGGPVAVIITLAVLGAIIWIAKGFKK